MLMMEGPVAGRRPRQRRVAGRRARADRSLDADFRAMASLSAERFSPDEAREGIGALLDKRTPSWVPTVDS